MRCVIVCGSRTIMNVTSVVVINLIEFQDRDGLLFFGYENHLFNQYIISVGSFPLNSFAV